eukprot:scaffold189508_cov40-Prasinocladus_malaysianus.AAC.2
MLEQAQLESQNALKSTDCKIIDVQLKSVVKPVVFMGYFTEFTVLKTAIILARTDPEGRSDCKLMTQPCRGSVFVLHNIHKDYTAEAEQVIKLLVLVTYWYAGQGQKLSVPLFSELHEKNADYSYNDQRQQSTMCFTVLTNNSWGINEPAGLKTKLANGHLIVITAPDAKAIGSNSQQIRFCCLNAVNVVL